MLWELLFFLRKSLQFYQMLCIIYLLFTDGFPSGQRGQTVNLLAPPSKVRILLHPANLALTSLRCRSYFFVQKENRKGAAPLHTPRAFFKEFLVVDKGRVLTCVCMLGYWMWDAVPIWFLYASVLIVGHCADLVSVCFGVGCGVLCRFIFGGYGRLLYWLWIVLRPFSVCFGIGCGTLCRSGSCMLRCWTWNAVPIYFYILCFLALGRMYIRFYSLFSAVEFSAGDVATVWAAAEEV